MNLCPSCHREIVSSHRNFNGLKFRFRRWRDQIGAEFRCDPAEGGPEGDSARVKRVPIWGGSFCPFCGKLLASIPSRWYYRGYSLVVGFILFGPFILPLVWLNPATSAQKKVVVTLVVLGLTYVLFLLMKSWLVQYFEIYDQLLGAGKNGTVL